MSIIDCVLSVWQQHLYHIVSVFQAPYSMHERIYNVNSGYEREYATFFNSDI